MSRSEAWASGFAEESVPRTNGALVFEAPWQARAHAMAVLFVEATGSNWDAFRTCLVDAIGERPDRAYWESWVVALDRFATQAGLLN